MNFEFAPVRLGYREKHALYHNLSQIVRTGITFPVAVEKLAKTSRGSTQTLLRRVRQQLDRGKTIGEAFETQRSAITPMEAGVIAAVEQTGRLDRGFAQLAEYFDSMAKARSAVIRRSAYPIFVLHFGVFALALPALFTKGSAAYLQQTVGFLGCLYGVLIAVLVASPALADIASTSPSLDRLLRFIPFIGKMRRAFAMSRFVLTYEMQLDAGVNVFDAMTAAGRASRSGIVQSAARQVVRKVRGGMPVGEAVAETGSFPSAVIDAFTIGEQSGRLDQELARVADDLRAEALQRLDTFSDWLPKLLYVAILGYLAWSIITVFQGIYAPVYQLLD